MKERGILFRDRLVRRINIDAKTQTRRIMSPQPTVELDGLLSHPKLVGHFAPSVFGYCASKMIASPYGGPGDRLWVREAWRTWERPADMVDGILYRSDHAFRAIENTREAAELWVEAHGNGKHGDNWRPSIFMFRWMARTLLDIVAGARVERLQDISDADAIAEGVNEDPSGIFWGAWQDDDHQNYFTTAREAFADIWRDVNGPKSWDENPWLWVVSFSRAVEAARSAAA